MTFEEAYALDVGSLVFVSNGQPQPPGTFGDRRYNLWRAHNFGGEVVGKEGEAPFRVLLISDLGAEQSVTYGVQEWVPLTFSTDPPA